MQGVTNAMRQTPKWAATNAIIRDGNIWFRTMVRT